MKRNRYVRKESEGIPAWAWYITWAIMAAGIVLNVIGIVGLLR